MICITMYMWNVKIIIDEQIKKKKTDIENKLVVTIEEKKDKLEVGDKEVCIYCYE